MAVTENRVAQVRNRFESLKQNPQEPTTEGGGPASNKKGGKIPKTIEPNENRKRERVEKEMEGGKVKVRKKEWEEGKKAQLWGEMLKKAEPEIVNCDCEQSQTDNSKMPEIQEKRTGKEKDAGWAECEIMKIKNNSDQNCKKTDEYLKGVKMLEKGQNVEESMCSHVFAKPYQAKP